MNSSEFIAALKLVACKGAIAGVFSSIEHPPGRRPDPEFVRLGEWLRSRSPEERRCVQEIAGLAAKQATYNMLLVIDGLLTVESSPDKGTFELWFKKEAERIQLNSPDNLALSSLFKAAESNEE